MTAEEKLGMQENRKLKAAARESKRARAAQLAGEGLRVADIAARLGMPQQTVRAALTASGVAATYGKGLALGTP